jgi:hypothetical protein
MGNAGLLVLFAAAFFARSSGAAATTPAIWAMYYAWYETGNGPHAKWSQWSDDSVTNSHPHAKSKAQPLIGHYDSDDSNAVRWHMQLAKAAGIDAFLVSWWGGANISGQAFEKTILPVARAERFSVAICNELSQFHHDLKTLTQQTVTLLRNVKDDPAYLHRDGHPVMYLYQVPFAPRLTPESFQTFQREVESQVGPVYWVMDKVANDANGMLTIPQKWLDIPQIQMIGFYGTFSVKRVWRYEELRSDYLHLAQQAHTAHKNIFLPVHPGHDNSGFRPTDFFVIPRNEGDTLRGYLRAATEAGADVLLLTSFNEWPETTVVEPSSSWPDPYLYLKIVAKWKNRVFVPPPVPARNQ